MQFRLEMLHILDRIECLEKKKTISTSITFFPPHQCVPCFVLEFDVFHQVASPPYHLAGEVFLVTLLYFLPSVFCQMNVTGI